MEGNIVNRVAKSPLITVDLEEYYPEGERILFDIKNWLYEGLVLREKNFRHRVESHKWEQYEGCYVALTCSSDAIIPDWAYMFLTIHLEPFAKKVVVGNLIALETNLYQDIINTLDVSKFMNKPVIIKGCSKRPVPTSAYVLMTKKLKPVAKSIMFGEACSSVPLYKSTLSTK